MVFINYILKFKKMSINDLTREQLVSQILHLNRENECLKSELLKYKNICCYYEKLCNFGNNSEEMKLKLELNEHILAINTCKSPTIHLTRLENNIDFDNDDNDIMRAQKSNDNFESNKTTSVTNESFNNVISSNEEVITDDNCAVSHRNCVSHQNKETQTHNEVNYCQYLEEEDNGICWQNKQQTSRINTSNLMSNSSECEIITALNDKYNNNDIECILSEICSNEDNDCVIIESDAEESGILCDNETTDPNININFEIITKKEVNSCHYLEDNDNESCKICGDITIGNFNVEECCGSCKQKQINSELNQTGVIKCEEDLRENIEECGNNIMIDSVIDEQNVTQNFDYISNQLITPLNNNMASKSNSNDSTVSNIYQNYKKVGSVCKKRGRKSILTLKQKTRLNEWYEQNRWQTMSQLAKRVLDEWNISVSNAVIYSYINRNNNNNNTNNQLNKTHTHRHKNNGNNILNHQSVNRIKHSYANKSGKRKNRVINNEKQKRIIEAINSGKSHHDMSKMFKLNDSTVRKIYQNYQNYGSIYKKRGRKKALNFEQKTQLNEWYEQNPSQTLSELVKRVFKEWNINVSINTVYCAINRKNTLIDGVIDEQNETENFDCSSNQVITPLNHNIASKSNSKTHAHNSEVIIGSKIFHQNYGSIYKKRGRKMALNFEQKSQLNEWYKQNRSQTLSQLAKRVLDEWNISVSINTIYCYVKRKNNT